MSMTPIQKVEVLRAACCVAGADGVTDDAEMKTLLQLAEDVGVGQASLQAMISRAESDPEFCNEQFRFLKDRPSECLAILLQVATANSEISEVEEKVLARLASNLGVNQDIFDQLVEKAKSISGG